MGAGKKMKQTKLRKRIKNEPIKFWIIKEQGIIIDKVLEIDQKNIERKIEKRY